jgi:hypothetical protein
MKAVRDLSIRRKQMLIIMLTSSVTLLLACVAFIAYDVYKFRQELVEKESSVAHVVGNAVTAAIDFNDQKTAEESLAALRRSPTSPRPVSMIVPGRSSPATSGTKAGR